MAKKTKLTVTSELGTFTRTTVRTYSHLIVVKGYKAERLEARRLIDITSERQTAAKYRRTIATGVDLTDRTPFHREHTAKVIASGELAQWANECDARADASQAKGPITEDGNSWSDTDRSVPTWGVVGWCGRLDLAQKLFAQQDDYRHAAIIDVTTGALVARR